MVRSKSSLRELEKTLGGRWKSQSVWKLENGDCSQQMLIWKPGSRVILEEWILWYWNMAENAKSKWTNFWWKFILTFLWFFSTLCGLFKALLWKKKLLKIPSDPWSKGNENWKDYWETCMTEKSWRKVRKAKDHRKLFFIYN